MIVETAIHRVFPKRMFRKAAKYTRNPSPNLSPKRREALKPPFPTREGGLGGLGLGGLDVSNNTFQTTSKIHRVSCLRAGGSIYI